MYVVGYAKSTLKIARGDIRKTGEKVPEAINWPPHVLNAHLSMNFLMTEDAYNGWKKQADVHDAYRKERNDKMRGKHKGQEKESTGEEKAEKPKESETDKKSNAKTESDESPKAVDPVETELGDLSKSQLKKIAKEKGLMNSGTKGELADRIRQSQ